MGGLRATKMSRDMVLSELGAQRAWQLGAVQLIYLEPAGGLGIIRYTRRPRARLSRAGCLPRAPGETHQPRTNASKSGLITSELVVSMPCGKPG